VKASNAPTTAGDYTLQATSPVIEQGDNALNDTTTDLAGNPRILDGNAATAPQSLTWARMNTARRRPSTWMQTPPARTLA
jgi:hypothetical protein